MKEQVDAAVRDYHGLLKSTNHEIVARFTEKNEEEEENAILVNKIWRMKNTEQTSELQEKKRDHFSKKTDFGTNYFLSFLEAMASSFQYFSLVGKNWRSF